MDWVPVEVGLPDTRRRVLVWGIVGCAGLTSKPQFLGDSRCNIGPSGGRFDIERSRVLGWSKVTHWCEVVGPDEPPSTALREA